MTLNCRLNFRDNKVESVTSPIGGDSLLYRQLVEKYGEEDGLDMMYIAASEDAMASLSNYLNEQGEPTLQALERYVEAINIENKGEVTLDDRSLIRTLGASLNTSSLRTISESLLRIAETGVNNTLLDITPQEALDLHHRIQNTEGDIYLPEVGPNSIISEGEVKTIDEVLEPHLVEVNTREEFDEVVNEYAPQEFLDEYNSETPVSPEEEMAAIKDKAIQNNTFMKAPNGEDTNLTERQWLQVRTEAFKNWFGDWQNNPENASKIIDENGEPLVVYHGAGNSYFTEFKPFFRLPNQRGYFFFESRSEAEKWGRNGRVIAAFLNISNPLTVDYGGGMYQIERVDNMFQQLQNENGIIIENIKDPIVLTNQYVALSPNQIKSATDNVGTFSENSNDIRFQISEEQGAQNLDQESEAFNEVVNQLNRAFPNTKVHQLNSEQIVNKLKELGVSEDVRKQVPKRVRYYHSNTRGLRGKFRLINSRGYYGVYFSPSKKVSQVFGDQTYKVDIYPKNTYTIRKMSEFRNKYGNFFNLDKSGYEKLLKDGYDSVERYNSKGQLEELLVIDIDSIGDREISFQKELSNKGITLTTNGFVHNGEVYLNTDNLNPETPIHEFAHIYNSWLKDNRPYTYQRGIELINEELTKENSKIKSVIDYVKETQPNLKGESLSEEILAQLIGERGVELINRNKKGGIVEWIKNVWDEIRNFLGLSSLSTEQVANLTIQDFAEMAATDLLKGERLTSEMESIKERAIEDGTFMKAPNGNSTNLNERQWLQVRTEAFKNWFGDWINDPQNASKVVDENGEPMVVYHGTPSNIQPDGSSAYYPKTNPFNIFRSSKERLGLGNSKIYFASNRNIADNYATEYGHTIPVFLNIRNIDRFYGGKKEFNWLSDESPSFLSFIEDFDSRGLDGVVVEDIYDHPTGSGKIEASDIYVVKSSNQIKSATDNVGTFSSESNDIRFQIQGSAELFSSTSKNMPKVSGVKVFKKADTEINYRDASNHIVLELIQTPQEARGEGQAQSAMNDLVAYADQTRKPIYLDVVPRDSETNESRLRGFYERNGFTFDDSMTGPGSGIPGTSMVRYPKRVTRTEGTMADIMFQRHMETSVVRHYNTDMTPATEPNMMTEMLETLDTNKANRLIGELRAVYEKPTRSINKVDVDAIIEAGIEAGVNLSDMNEVLANKGQTSLQDLAGSLMYLVESPSNDTLEATTELYTELLPNKVKEKVTRERLEGTDTEVIVFDGHVDKRQAFEEASLIEVGDGIYKRVEAIEDSDVARRLYDDFTDNLSSKVSQEMITDSKKHMTRAQLVEHVMNKPRAESEMHLRRFYESLGEEYTDRQIKLHQMLNDNVVRERPLVREVVSERTIVADQQSVDKFHENKLKNSIKNNAKYRSIYRHLVVTAHGLTLTPTGERRIGEIVEAIQTLPISERNVLMDAISQSRASNVKALLIQDNTTPVTLDSIVTNAQNNIESLKEFDGIYEIAEGRLITKDGGDMLLRVKDRLFLKDNDNGTESTYKEINVYNEGDIVVDNVLDSIRDPRYLENTSQESENNTTYKNQENKIKEKEC